MASTFTVLSGSTDGRPIKVVQAATPGTQIHQVDAAALSQIWLWCNNTDTVPRLLTLEFGGVTDPDDLIEITIPAQSGAILVIAGAALEDSVNIKAFAAAANVLNIIGYVEEIT